MAVDQKSRRRSARAEAKRELIIQCAMRHFAEHGYQGARIEDIAQELEIAKGSVFQHYGSKAGLFLECYKRAVSSLPAWLEAPDEVRQKIALAAVDVLDQVLAEHQGATPVWKRQTSHQVPGHVDVGTTDTVQVDPAGERPQAAAQIDPQALIREAGEQRP